MRFTSKSRYGLLALAYLARESRAGAPRHVPTGELAAHCGTSGKYLEQVLLPLTHAGIVESKRGATGGYRLRRPPGEISLADALRALDGRLLPIPGWASDAPPLGGFGRVLLDVRAAIRAILEAETLDVFARGPGGDPAGERAALEGLDYYI